MHVSTNFFARTVVPSTNKLPSDLTGESGRVRGNKNYPTIYDINFGKFKIIISIYVRTLKWSH